MFGHRLVGGFAIVWLLCGVFQPVSVSPPAFRSSAALRSRATPDQHTSKGSNAPNERIVSQAEDFSANHSLRVKRACLGKEPFACVAKSIIDGLPAGAASKKSSISDTGCANCDVENCQLIDGGSIDGHVLTTTLNMRAVAKCTPKDDTCGYTDSAICLKPVSFVTDGQEHSELFPFNLCTRKMVVDGTCPKHLLSTSPYDVTKLVITLDYHVQCDLGLMVPPIAANIGCVPSLHQAAGLAPGDPSIFPDDITDFDNIQFCAAELPLPDPLNCMPRPLQGFPLAVGMPKSVLDAANTPCLYPARGAKKAEDCVLLDLLIPPTDTQKAPLIIPGDRNGLGPYAALQSTFGNLDRKWTAEEEPQRIFPRCIEISDVAGLTQLHIDEVQKDFYLNCETNPYYQKAVTTRNAAQMAALKIEPAKCATVRSSARLFCRWHVAHNATADAVVREQDFGALLDEALVYPSWITYNSVVLGLVLCVTIILFVIGYIRASKIKVLWFKTNQIANPKLGRPSKQVLAVVAKFVKAARKEVFGRGVAKYVCQNQEGAKLLNGSEYTIPTIHVPKPGPELGSKARTIARLTHFCEAYKHCVVQCATGAGWSNVFLMVVVLLDRLRQGTEVEVIGLFKELRSIHPDAITDPEQYMAIYMALLEYIKAYLPEHSSAIRKFLAGVGPVMKKDAKDS
ncbi:unnamed protein product, partial [Mesorhabditis spiculigera]